jgi:hypothetical protein
LPKEHYREQLLHNYEINNNNINNNPNNIGYKNYNNNNIPNDNDINEEEFIYREREREREREKERLEMMKERQTPQKLDNFQLNRVNNNNQINYENPNINNNKNIINNNQEEYHPKYPPYYQKEKENMELYEQMKYDSGMVRNKDKIPNVNYAEQINEYNYINDIAKKNAGNLVLPMTKNQILQEVYLENFNRKHSPK